MAQYKTEYGKSRSRYVKMEKYKMEEHYLDKILATNSATAPYLGKLNG